MRRRDVLIGSAALGLTARFGARAADGAVVETTTGKVRGLAGERVQAFLGVPAPAGQ